MAATYVNNLRVAEPADGDSDWGSTTNTSLELIGEALGYGTDGITTNADTHASRPSKGDIPKVYGYVRFCMYHHNWSEHHEAFSNYRERNKR